MGLSLREDGRMCFVMITKGADGQPVQLKSLGTWRVDGEYLVLTDETGTNQFKYSMDGEQTGDPDARPEYGRPLPPGPGMKCLAGV